MCCKHREPPGHEWCGPNKCVVWEDCAVVAVCDGNCQPTKNCEFALKATAKPGPGLGKCDDCRTVCPAHLPVSRTVINGSGPALTVCPGPGVHVSSGFDCLVAAGKEGKSTARVDCDPVVPHSKTLSIRVELRCGAADWGSNCKSPGVLRQHLGSCSVVVICSKCPAATEEEN